MPLGSLLGEMQDAIASAVGPDVRAVAEMARPMGVEGARRPKLFVLTRLPLNHDRLERLLNVASGTSVIVWPFFAAHVSIPPTGDDKGRGEWVHPQKLRTVAGAALDWADYACRAIATLQPRDILLLGGGAEGLIKAFPRRPTVDHDTRGRDYEPLVISEMQPFAFGKDKWPDHLNAWESKMAGDWDTVVAPHLKKHYFSGAAVIPGTSTIDAQQLMKREKIPKKTKPAAVKTRRVAALPRKVDAWKELMRDKRPRVGSLDSGRDTKKQKN